MGNGVSLNRQLLKGRQQLKRWLCCTGVTWFVRRLSDVYRGLFQLTILFFAHFNRVPEKGGSILGLNAKCFDANLRRLDKSKSCVTLQVALQSVLKAHC